MSIKKTKQVSLSLKLEIVVFKSKKKKCEEDLKI